MKVFFNLNGYHSYHIIITNFLAVRVLRLSGYLKQIKIQIWSSCYKIGTKATMAHIIKIPLGQCNVGIIRWQWPVSLTMWW